MSSALRRAAVAGADVRSGSAQASRTASARVAGGLLVLSGLGFGLPAVWGARHLHQTGDVWTLPGYPTYGDGPFEHHGVETTVPLLGAFCLVCGLQVVAGVRLWNTHRDGAILALALVPLGAAFWWGFALPVGPVLAAASAGLMLRCWRILS